MEAIINNIQNKLRDLNAELNANKGGNKAAGARARKLTLELTKLFKEYRQASVAAAKK